MDTLKSKANLFFMNVISSSICIDFVSLAADVKV